MTKVYYMVDEHARVKIGVSYHPGIRLKAIQPTCSGLLTLVATEPGGRRREAELHVRFAHLHIHHEWVFLQDDLLEYVTSISDDVRRAVEELPTKETATRNVIREKLVAPAQEESERIIRDAQRKGAAIISKARRLPPQKAHKEAQRIVTTAKTEAQALLLKAQANCRRKPTLDDRRCVLCGQAIESVVTRIDGDRWCDACWLTRPDANIYSDIARQAREMGLGRPYR